MLHHNEMLGDIDILIDVEPSYPVSFLIDLSVSGCIYMCDMLHFPWQGSANCSSWRTVGYRIVASIFNCGA
jgi:hypothetical protein